MNGTMEQQRFQRWRQRLYFLKNQELSVVEKVESLVLPTL